MFDRPNYATRWTPEDLERVSQMLGAGQTIPEIAKAMGRSQEAVRNKALSSGLLKRRRRKSGTTAA